MHEEKGSQQRTFYLGRFGREWWRWWSYYDEDEVLSSPESIVGKGDPNPPFLRFPPF